MGFAKKTVFVIGAGAHVNYGMPTGPELISDLRTWCYSQSSDAEREAAGRVDDALTLVCRKVKGDAHWCSSNVPTGDYDHELDTIKDFVRQLTGSPHDSIDSMLAAAKSHESLGKWIISALILRSESRALLVPGVPGWHRWFVQRCTPAVDSSQPNPVWNFQNCSIVTFNYDRLFEMHVNTLTRNWSDCDSAATGIPKPLHVYGDVQGTPRWVSQLRRFSSSPTMYDTFQSGNAIKIADGRSADDDHFKKVKDSLRGAEQVVFLGFAFDAANLLRLGLGGNDGGESSTPLNPNAKVFATAYQQDRDMVRRAQDGLGAFEINWGKTGQGCFECLKSWDIL
jgi:hypothetical protein